MHCHGVDGFFLIVALPYTRDKWFSSPIVNRGAATKLFSRSFFWTRYVQRPNYFRVQFETRCLQRPRLFLSSILNEAPAATKLFCSVLNEAQRPSYFQVQFWTSYQYSDLSPEWPERLTKMRRQGTSHFWVPFFFRQSLTATRPCELRNLNVKTVYILIFIWSGHYI